MDKNSQFNVKGFQSKIKEFYSVRLGQAFQRFSEEPKAAKKSLKRCPKGAQGHRMDPKDFKGAEIR